MQCNIATTKFSLGKTSVSIPPVKFSGIAEKQCVVKLEPALTGQFFLECDKFSKNATNIESLFDESVQKHQAGDLTGAAIGYAAVLNADSRYSEAWHFAVLIAHQMGNSNDALQQIKYAIEIDPVNPEYYSNLASILNSMVE